MTTPLRIAILGGGLAGCTLANGLLRHAHIHFDLYERKDFLGERGTGVALDVNAFQAVEAMGLDAQGLFKAAGAVQMASTRCLVAHGEHAGEPLLELPGGTWIVDRAALLQELVKTLPHDRLHSNKKLVAIDQTAGAPVKLRFEDGSEATADAVIGCDGIHSQARQIILGPDHPAVAPVFGGYWDARGALSVEQAVKQFGTKLFDPREPTQLGLVGDGVFMLFAPSMDGKKYNAIVSGVAGSEWDPTAWKMDLDREMLEKKYEAWNPEFRKGVLDCITGEGSGTGVMYAQWESPETPMYCSGRLVIMGDSAHAPTPWVGQGAGMSFEDASVMSAILQAVDAPDQLERAFKAFDKERHARPEYVARRSHDIGKLLTGGMGLNPARLANLDAPAWWKYILRVDMKQECQFAVETFHNLAL